LKKTTGLIIIVKNKGTHYFANTFWKKKNYNSFQKPQFQRKIKSDSVFSNALSNPICT